MASHTAPSIFMKFVDRFRSQPSRTHSDVDVRLTHVAGLPLSDRAAIVAIAREDDDPRVRRAAIGKVLDPEVLGTVLSSDPDESVRERARAMLRDIALDAFEGLTEADSLAAVAVLTDQKVLAQIAKGAESAAVALGATAKVTDLRGLGSIARHAVAEPARERAFDELRARGAQAEILATALRGEHKDTAVAAVNALTARAELEQVAARAMCKGAAKRARTVLREADERMERERQEAAEAARRDAEARAAESAAHRKTTVPDMATSPTEPQTTPADAVVATEDIPPASTAVASEPEPVTIETQVVAMDAAPAVAEAPAVVTDDAAPAADVPLPAETQAQPAEDAQARAEADAEEARRRAAEREVEARARREALTKLEQLIARVEPLAVQADLSLKAIDRALTTIRAALSSLPRLPRKEDHDEVTRRLKAVQAALVPKGQELREALEWQRWANANVQEQLCVQMEALQALADPEAIATSIRELQEQWRRVADVPRAKAEQLWWRFKAAHDVVWPRCEAYFAARTQARDANQAEKVALCEKAEALADSVDWVRTAEAIKELQTAWKKVGPVPQGQEKSLWDRFHAACDRFFTRRRDDLVQRKSSWTENFAKKDALCVAAEALAQSTDWDHAAAELRRLQAEWKTIGAVKPTRSDAIWKRFRGACDAFFARYADRHNIARVERVAAREAICAELEQLIVPEATEAPADLAGTARQLRARWQEEIAARGVAPDQARALDQRFAAAFAAVVGRWPDAFRNTEFDPSAGRKQMERLTQRMEELATSLAGPAAPADDNASSATRLARMLKEALAANTIGGKADDQNRLRAASDEMRQAQIAWSRVGLVPDDVSRPLAERFQRACRQIADRVGHVAQAAPSGRPSGGHRDGGPSGSRGPGGPRRQGGPGRPAPARAN